MYVFKICQNAFLQKDIEAFYHTDYVGYRKPGNPDYINELKNTYGDKAKVELDKAVQELRAALSLDLPVILRTLKSNSLTVCVVPRAKAESKYIESQLLFKSTVRSVINQLNGYNDGVDYIVRHTNTRTTHLPPNTPNYDNDGKLPYKGITNETCKISHDVRSKHILLIDDLYTATVNIDEDAIQALLDNGAQEVTFYSVGRTKYKRL